MAIDLLVEGVKFKISDKRYLKSCIKEIINRENFNLGNISIIFCSDDYLLQINQKYLNHDYFTDIITFNYNEKKIISGDIFISIDRVGENAKEFSTDFSSELYRVIFHGILHLVGYDDIADSEKLLMREKEDFYIEHFRKFIY